MGDYVALVCIGVLAVAVITWLRRRRDRRYNLEELFDRPAEEPDHEDMIDESSGPYCFRCDHPNPPGAFICRSCGQKLG
jgi:hypothetical protein